MAPTSARILLARALRGFVDGLVSVILAGYLTRLGFTTLEVGAIVAATLLGSAALTTAVGLAGLRLEQRQVLVGASLLMIGTGVGFAGVTEFWPLLAIAFLGTLNPAGGDVSVFLPAEQAVLADVAEPARRATSFARYNVAGALAAALGALASALPALAASRRGVDLLTAERAAFIVYAAIGVLSAFLYRRLSVPSRPSVRASSATSGNDAAALDEAAENATSPPPLARSRRVVLHLAALFTLDSFGGGFVVQSMLVLWLHLRFELSLEAMGAIFFAANLLGALSQLASPYVARRIGLVRTMVYTHLPANLFLAAAGLVSSAPAAVALLLARAALSQMDVPARQAYVMALVPPEERPAAASITNVPRSLAAALPPVLTGMMLEHTTFGWPLICAGVLKGLYDVLLLVQFRSVEPPADA